MEAEEINFDGLVGPTHNFGGLSLGNVASIASKGRASNPRAAALQGLAKMRLMMGLGVPQGILPPHERPHVGALRRLGFSGTDGAIVEAAFKADPTLLANLSSASAMWTANAATVSPSADTEDGRVHITPANLAAKLHRSIEAAFSTRLLRAIFADPDHFVVHDFLPQSGKFGDEGAANHMRLAPNHGAPGVEIFVYGRSAFDEGAPDRGFEPRQALEASQAVARLHGLGEGKALFLQQARQAVDAGAFHNDVVAVANGPVLFAHEHAFEDGEASFEAIPAACSFNASLIVAREAEVPLTEAVRSYLFNSQLVSRPGKPGSMTLTLPEDVKSSPAALAFAQGLVASGTTPIDELIFVDLRQSMWNGGGPACLRLRIVLTGAERDAMQGKVLLDEILLARLEDWVSRHYRDRLTGADLGDPALLEEGRRALDELSGLLGLGSIYPFQRA
ncbi:succinylarginine dihydrolase [Methylocella silvestris BL2]|uniref:N-succinylarginine dihydrolase n=1 Tax=Methylocella silvestris (strain DSM 15510 / CIP 108128 / LMG 27833 / NCIMB 13906 / BL2) TaxID=395965 RepID=B8EN85_METSB|nr:N-succinylarginine dihydrolase [Methylocella silvestris]ACK49598.1 succinylarginine dihydrolase [Methylocella silvestris BL2]